jgi:hypothetical protein
MRRFLHLIRYIKLLKLNKKILADSRINNNPNPLGIQYDWIYRLYTVLNLPAEDKEFIEKYGFQDTKNVYYVENKVKLHIVEINNFLFELGILEYVALDTEKIEQIDESNVRIVLKFKHLDLKFWAKFLIIFGTLLFITGIVSLFIFI